MHINHSASSNCSSTFHCWLGLVFAQNPSDCSKVPDHSKLKAALTGAVKEGKGKNGGLGNQEWGTVVNRDGIVCAVVFTGPNRGRRMAGQSLDFGGKSEHSKRFQHRQLCTFVWERVRRGAAGQFSLQHRHRSESQHRLCGQPG